MTSLPADLLAAYDLNWKPRKVLSGKDQAGAWQTSQAKEYPAAMCRVLAENYIKHAAERECEGTEADPPGLSAAIEVLARVYDPYLDAQEMGHDFQPAFFN